jgi:hypothetical protein
MLGLAKAIREGGEEVLCGVSDATGTSYERLARIAAGTSEWYGFELGRIADALGCSMYEAATGEPPAEYDPSDGPRGAFQGAPYRLDTRDVEADDAPPLVGAQDPAPK